MGADFLARDWKYYKKNMEEFCTKFMFPGGDILLSCGAGNGGGCVDAYGRLQLCMMLRHPETVYDLKTGTIKDALENFFPKIRARRVSHPEYLERCARCFLKGLCEQCAAKSWMEHGDLETPVEYQCEVAHAQALNLGLLSPGENAWEVEDWKARIIRAFGKQGGEDGNKN
jgi:radical SAM protein with 4Fe4S-binding SPASM domain